LSTPSTAAFFAAEAVFLALHLVLRDPLNFLNLIGHVAAFVYLADVRPTLRAMPRH